MAEIQIPHLDFTELSGQSFGQQAEKWKNMSMKVREACEKYGCFLVKYDKILMIHREKMFKAMETFFYLPLEIKKSYKNPKVFHGYTSIPGDHNLESLAIDEVAHRSIVQAFTNFMWPSQGNRAFFDALHTISSAMLEMNLMSMKMIFESYGVSYCSNVYDDNTTSGTMSMIKYNSPTTTNSSLVLPPHTDVDFLTTFCQNSVQGFEVLTKDGEWIEVYVPEDSFLVVVGDCLMAWSNGRLHSPRQRLTTKGEKVRYSFGFLLFPKGIVEVPKEFVDEDHPLLYKPYNYAEFLKFFKENTIPNALKAFAAT